MIHCLKTWPKYFIPLLFNAKSFEIRKNDRGFKTGDYLVLQEWDPKTEKYTGQMVTRQVTYIFDGGEFGVPDDLVVMALIMV